ncbi:hypothetical protein ACQEVC_01910 [Plantactinospora sp. CA-294935]
MNPRNRGGGAVNLCDDDGGVVNLCDRDGGAVNPRKGVVAP